MIDTKWIGTKTDWIRIIVTRKEIQQYCHIIGEKNPIYHDLDSAKEAGFTDFPLPPAYPILFWRHFELPWLPKKDTTMMHCKQSFSYKHALTANKVYNCQLELQKVRARGEKQFAVHRLSVYDENQLAAIGNTTLLLSYQRHKE